MGTNEKELISDKVLKGVIIFFIFVIITLLVIHFSIFNGDFSPVQEHWGSFGDFLGGVGGTMLSALAVLLIFLTYHLQKDELEKTREALGNQNKQLDRQQYQNLFFKLLERKDYIISNIKYSKDAEGYVALKNIRNLFIDEIKNYHYKKEALENKWNYHKYDLNPYFRNVVTTINYIIEYDFEGKDYKVRDQLIQIYANNTTQVEREVLNLIFEYHVLNDKVDEELQDSLKHLGRFMFFELSTENQKYYDAHFKK